MFRLTRPTVGLFFLILLVSLLQTAQAETLRGTVRDKGSGKPIPGLEVKLYHPAEGESRPTYTNQYGEFYFPFVPYQSDPYDLEFYWRERLIFREQIKIRGDQNVGPYDLE